jgi:L-glyceraldehyde 3-phosphate reductase
MLDREPEEGLLNVLEKENIAGIAFSPLAQGLLTDRYLNGIPLDSRAKRFPQFLPETRITLDVLQGLNQLKKIAANRGQSMAEMALTWVLRDPKICSVIIGASSIGQLSMNLKAINSTPLSIEELNQIDCILASHIWK